MDQYLSNLLTLTAVDTELAAEVSRTRAAEHVRTFPAKSGAPTAELRTEDGRTILLHSRYDPVDEAQAFARSADTEKVKVYVVLGFGLGYHLKALWAAARRESRIIVIERDVAVFRTALETMDLRELFASRRFVPIVGKAVPDIFRALNRYVVEIFLDTSYLVHRPSVEASPEYYTEVHKSLSDYVNYGMQNVVTTVSVAFLSKMNCMMNLPYYAFSPGIARYKDSYAGCPAIIVSAGPSLHRNVEVLRRAQGRAVIIAVSTIFKPLLGRSIKPDFAVVLDYHPISKKYFEAAEGDEDVVLVADPKASYDAVEAHRGPKAVIHNDALHAIIGSPAWHKGSIAAGTTVAHSAFYFAEYIGADPIIFVGQDLAHPDGITHFPGTAVHDVWAAEANRFQSLEQKEWETILRMRHNLKKIKDVHGNDIYTDNQMFAYLQQFEMNFFNSKAKVIDATEGGAAKRYTTAMPLAEAIERYGKDALPPRPDRPPAERPDAAGEGARGEIEGVIEAHLKRMAKVRAFYDKTVAILKDIDEAWPDQRKLAPLLAEIDGIREEVKTYTEVNNLVRDIAQMVELRKVQADRKILSDRLDGLDKQKAQLARDLDYVGGLREQVDELEKMFAAALERFKAFDYEGKVLAPLGEGRTA